MKTETMIQQLVALTQLPQEGFRDYLDRAASLYQVLYGERCPHLQEPPKELPASAASTQSENVLSPVLPASSVVPVGNPTPEGVRPRPPMRPPAAGSLRESVYFVLEAEKNPAAPKRVVELVAAMRNVPVSENLKASIGEILRNRHDPKIRRIGSGLYAIVPEKIAA